MHNHLPFEGYSYFIESENQYRLGALVPYGTYNYRVEVLFPVLPITKSHIEIPEIYLKDFQTYVGYGLVDDENSKLYGIYNALMYSAKRIVDINWVGDVKEYTRIVCLYVAHKLQLHIALLKDEEEKMSLSPEEREKKEEKEALQIDMMANDFRKTGWGHMYWAEYGMHQKYNIGYRAFGGY